MRGGNVGELGRRVQARLDLFSVLAALGPPCQQLKLRRLALLAVTALLWPRRSLGARRYSVASKFCSKRPSRKTRGNTYKNSAFSLRALLTSQTSLTQALVNC